MTRRHYAIALQQASEESPTLARLAALTRESSERLALLQPLMPPPLRALVRAGPIDGGEWCLLVRGNAAASKLRQMIPAFEAALRTSGREVTRIRLKIHSG